MTDKERIRLLEEDNERLYKQKNYAVGLNWHFKEGIDKAVDVLPWGDAENANSKALGILKDTLSIENRMYNK